MTEQFNIHEPVDMYRDKLKDLHAKNTSEFFENLVKKAGVNEEENIATVKDIRKHQKEIDEFSKRNKKYRSLRSFLVILAIIGFVAGAYYIYGMVEQEIQVDLVPILVAILAPLFAIGMLLIVFLKVNKIIKNLEEILAGLRKRLQELYNEAYAQMKPLNDLYDWGMSAEIVSKTIPLVELDPYFDNRRFDYLHRKYGLVESLHKDRSVIYVQSGQIVGNPFLVAKDVEFNMGQKEYWGSLDISWTVTREVNGSIITETKHQTLRASVVKPYPNYHYNSYIIYGNEAAPDLTFSREPSNANSMSPKEIEKFVKSEGKKIEKLSQKSVKNATGFEAMGNLEFEALFGATDRNNETQFRLLFTPLAQQEILKIIKDKSVGYGDDFSFVKDKELNFIYPRHLDRIDMSADPRQYYTFELAEARAKFNSYNNLYFKSFFFAFAPILAIPLYQQHKPHEFIYKDVYNYNVSLWEHEATVNYMDITKFKHPDSVTTNILKTSVVDSADGVDKLRVTAYGFAAEDRVDYVPVRGGDGYVHQVPVYWVEYIPVSQESEVVVKVSKDIDRKTYADQMSTNKSWKDFFASSMGVVSPIFRRRMIAFLSQKQFGSKEYKALTSLLAKNNDSEQNKGDN